VASVVIGPSGTGPKSFRDGASGEAHDTRKAARRLAAEKTRELSGVVQHNDFIENNSGEG